ncbi:unnamed protein product [Cladocopium goreaui]|uniref:Fibronectin type-II domain-containing protein n=1 Tax=Cladocopium goreaui TaxID=2562237 RepID=A0A9P1D1Y1_9DINO|nr:unnamed protein product [Cladocopium goreaui]|mmetsp:Transcript_50898/g.110973  ORF Transcript_50898/g.110973 Transcript_50898/m.110973 type:complete len:173 (+) Transcript_50898:122-640(+)
MAEDNKEMTAIAYQAARENFEALMEGLGQSDVEMMPFEFTDAERLEAAVNGSGTCVFLVLIGGTDVDLTKLENKLVVQEPRSEEENYEYTHSFVIIKTEEEGAQCFQQYPGGMDSDKECFSIDCDFFDGLQRLVAHGCVVPKTFQRLFCGSLEPNPYVLPAYDRMIMKGVGF